MHAGTTSLLIAIALLASTAIPRAQDVPPQSFSTAPAGFPAIDEVSRLYDEADLDRAVQAYRFFYPTVSGAVVSDVFAFTTLPASMLLSSSTGVSSCSSASLIQGTSESPLIPRRASTK